MVCGWDDVRYIVSVFVVVIGSWSFVLGEAEIDVMYSRMKKTADVSIYSKDLEYISYTSFWIKCLLLGMCRYSV